MFALELYPRFSYVIVLYAPQKEEGRARIETHIPPIPKRAHNAPKEPPPPITLTYTRFNLAAGMAAHIVGPPVPRFFGTPCI